MIDSNPRTDIYQSTERRTSPAVIVLILLAIGAIGAVGYDLYTRQQSTQAADAQAQQNAQQTAQMQQQLQDAMARVQQSDANAQNAEQERIMWMALARAAAGTVAQRPPTIYNVQRAVFGSADAQSRQILREYFKKPENIDKVTPIAVFVAGLMQAGPQTKAMAKTCEPLFTQPLPEMGPMTPDGLFCYEFLKRRQAEGGDLAAWQRLLAGVAAEINKKS